MELKSFIAKVIREELQKKIQNKFSLEDLQACQTPNKALAYLNSMLGTPIGKGEYRKTFAISDKMVVKIGSPQQNQQETKNSRCLPKEYVVQVLEHHPKFWWIIEERLTPTSSDAFLAAFEAKTGIHFSYAADITDAINYAISHECFLPPSCMENNTELLKSPWYARLIKMLEQCNVASHDFHSGNWGIRQSTGELVLLDLGF